MTKKDVATRFWSRVAKAGKDECWLWTGRLSKTGYGRFCWDGVKRLAHRVAYQLTFGVDPGQLMVMHKCDVPACCNPNHLSLGTALDNNRDMINKGRDVRLHGSKNGSSKLTDEQIALIINSSASSNKLASELGISDSTIRLIRQGKLRQSQTGGKLNYQRKFKNREKTHCHNGHPYNEENTAYFDGGRHRRCRICYNEWQREYRLAQQKAGMAA